MAKAPVLDTGERGFESHHLDPMKKFNDKIALKITNGVGTMWCAYAFAILALISLPAAIASGSAIVIVAWVAQTFLQLVLLPIIIVGQNLTADTNDSLHAKIDAVHDHLGIEMPSDNPSVQQAA